MHSLIEKLISDSAPVLTDGAWGTQLQSRGLVPGGSPEIWNLEHPERVEEVARAYVDAGSRIVLTNSFGGTDSFWIVMIAAKTSRRSIAGPPPFQNEPRATRLWSSPRWVPAGKF